MPHWRSLVDSKYLNHTELQGKDCSVRIKATSFDEVIGSGGKKSKKGLLWFHDKQKAMVCGVAVLSTIASIYGDDIANWPGKWITLYPTTTEASGKTVGTIRVRPTAPKGKQAEPKDEREPGGAG